MAGKATAALKLSASLQIVLRALIEEGRKRDGDRSVLANVAAQANAIRRMRSLARKGGPTGSARHSARNPLEDRAEGKGGGPRREVFRRGAIERNRG